MINISIQSQPDGSTCGPTSLHAVYRYYGCHCTLEDVIQSVKRTTSGGSLAAFLGKDALDRGFNATIYVNNLTLFDPSWFKHGQSNPEFLMNKLQLQLKVKHDPDLIQASHAYIDFLKLGGEVKFELLNKQLLTHYFKQSIPILTGLSATYLYQSPRYIYIDDEAYHNDIEGTPCGHFVVLCGYDDFHQHVIVADPHEENPLSSQHFYDVDIHRLINAIMLGVLTYDANLLILTPKEPYANAISDR